MRHAPTVILSVVLIAVAVGTAGARPAEWPWEESWVDERHGWASGSEKRCVPKAALCATSDGGRSWRGIFDAKRLAGFHRASKSAGVVWASGGPPSSGGWSRAFWTRDGGRHWYESRALTRAGVVAVVSGDVLWVGAVQIRPFPPRAKAVCRGRWVSSLGGDADLPESICAGTIVEAGMRRRGGAGGGGNIRQLIAVKGGVVGLALLQKVYGAFAVFSWVKGRAESAQLSVGPDHHLGGEPVMAVQWPHIFVAVDVIDNPFDHTDAGSGHVVFESTDGGRTWTKH